jgi:hypothetical protein
MNTPRKKTAADLLPGDRIALAKQLMRKATDHVLHALALHETNQIVAYSDTLSSQIPPSHAAHAFNLFRDSLLHYGIIRLYAVWDDDRDLAAESIPVVVNLVDDHDVQLALMRQTCAAWARQGARLLTEPDPDPEFAVSIAKAVSEHEDRFGRQQAIKAARSLKLAIQETHEILASDDFRSIRQLRHRFLAHALSHTREETRVGPIPPPKHDELFRLLDRTLRIAHVLYGTVCGAGFDFEDSRRIDRKQAQALWLGTTIKPLR